MKVDNLDELQRIIKDWDGEIVVEAYDIIGHKGIAALSLVKNDGIYEGIEFEGNREDILSLFTDVLKKNIDKVLEEQKVTVQFAEKDIKRGIKKQREEKECL